MTTTTLIFVWIATLAIAAFFFGMGYRFMEGTSKIMQITMGGLCGCLPIALVLMLMVGLK